MNLMSKRQGIASILAALILLAGLGLTAGIYRAQTVLLAIQGSEPAANFSSFKINFTVGGVIAENFITAAPAGAAFLSWQYSRPVRLHYITQTIVGPVDGSKALRGMSLQYRDETGAWTEVLRGTWSEKEVISQHSLSVPEPQSGAAAAEWRLVGLEGGADGELIIGHLSPIPWDSSGVMRVVNSIDLDLFMFLGFFLAAAVLAVFNRARAGIILLLGGCVAAFIVMNIVTFWLICPPLLWAPDSSSYTVWPPNFARMPGMNLIYVSLLKIMSLKHVHALQINVMLACYFAALVCIAGTMGRYWPFIPFTIFPLTWGNFVFHGSYVLSETWFISGLLIALSGLISLIMGGGQKLAVWAGAGLLLTVCVRPVGVILVLPTVLAYRFIPGSLAHRRQLVALVIGPPVLGYLVMSAYGYILSGRFAPTSFNGVSLSGYTAWMLDANDLPEKYQEVGREAVAELQTVYAALPPMTAPERFVDFTVDRINTAVYLILLPRFTLAVARFFPELSHGDRRIARSDVLAEWWTANREQMAMTNDVLADWARNSIARNPIRYAVNCILNYLVLWRDSFVNYVTVGQWWRWRLYLEGYRLGEPEVRRHLPAEYNEYADGWRQAIQPHLLPGREFRLLSLRINEVHRYIAWGVMIVALVLSVMYLVPTRYNLIVGGMIIWALFVNAMFAGTVLFTTALTRYGEPMVPLLPLLGALALVWVVDFARSSLSLGSPTSPRSLPPTTS
jgi:hypothetical protein